MDFGNRFNNNSVNRPQTVRPSSAPEAVELPQRHTREGKAKADNDDLIVRVSRIGTTLLLFIVALLIASLVWLIYVSNPSSQMKYVDPNKLQAVFLNSGQVYFGNVQAINDKYTVLTNIFYLQTNNGSTTSTQSNQNVTLVKLGCELHAPYDRMIIDSSQVTFWENLQSNGQVAKAIAQWQQQNPSGQKCSEQGQTPSASTGLQNQSGTTVPNTTGNSTTTTPTTNTTTKH